MPGDTDVHRVDVIGGQRPVEHPLVVGVRLNLGRPGRERPAVHNRVDVFHGEVCTLDHTHLDGGSPGGPARVCPRGQTLQGGERIGQVGLQHNAGLEILQLRLVENALEHLDRQVEIAKLFHVEVDEFRGGCSGRSVIERGQPLHHPVDGFGVGPHRQLAHHRRHLDGDVVDVVALEQHPGAREPAVSLFLAEHGLPQQVEVEAGALLAKFCEGVVEVFGCGVDHEVADHVAQRTARDRHNKPRELGSETATERDRAAQVPGQKRGDAAAQALEVTASDLEVFRTHHTINEPEGEVESLGVFEYPGEALGAFVGRSTGRLLEPATNHRDRLIGQVVRKEVGVVLLR